jgi:hypothetical protein
MTANNPATAAPATAQVIFGKNASSSIRHRGTPLLERARSLTNFIAGSVTRDETRGADCLRAIDVSC